MEHKLPEITLAASDYNDLLFTAAFAHRRSDANAAFLLAELMRASLCHPDDLPEDVVSTNCRVVYRVDGELSTRAHLLVCPHNLLAPASELSILTPLGTALLGLRVGDRRPYREAERDHEVAVEGIGMRFLGAGVSRARSGLR